MSRKLKGIWLLGAALAVAAGSVVAASGAGLLPPVQVEARFEGRITPGGLPADKAAPVALTLAEKIGTQDGSHPPALQELDIDLDRHFGLSVKGLPRCSRPLQERDTRTGTLVNCEDAKVGSGTTELEVAFPEQLPMRIKSRTTIYNMGSRGGRTGFLLYDYFPAPVTGAIVSQLEVRRHSDGRYGWSGVLKVPKIANGAASITYLGFRFRKGIFSASCPDGTLQTRAGAAFADGTRLQSTTIHTCRSTSSG